MSGVITGKWQSTDTTTITIAAPGAGRYLALKSLNVYSDAAANITVQSPSGTTIWQTSLPAGGGGFDKDYAVDGEIKGAENAALVIAVSAGTYKISVTGVTYG